MKRRLLLLGALTLALMGCQGEAGVGLGQVHRVDLQDAVCFVAADLGGSVKSIDCEWKQQ